MSRVALILIGPPGAGKGTQARRLGKYLLLARISTGDILREAVREDSDLGQKANGFMESGDLVPDSLVNAIVEERLARKDCQHGFILDGYPRNLEQARFLSATLEKDDTQALAIGIQVRDEVLLERLASRRTCPNCEKVFNTKWSPSDGGDMCDSCGSILEHRKDDQVRVVAERLEVYSRDTEPLIEYFEKHGIYQPVNGEGSLDEIFSLILRVHEERRKASTGTNCNERSEESN